MNKINVNSQSEIVSEKNRTGFRRAFAKLLGVNAVSAGLSLANEALMGHSALGFTQLTMEGTDSGLVAGLGVSHKLDKQGKHLVASRWRQALYGIHIGVAGVGIAEGMRLMHEDARPTWGNIAISGLVGVINAHYIRHTRKHIHGEAHQDEPDIIMAEEDPIEVIQDVEAGMPNADKVHKLNIDGTTAIAMTNLAEAGGGVVGPVLQFGWNQGSATAAIGSSLAVAGIMARQIIIERRALSEFLVENEIIGQTATDSV